MLLWQTPQLVLLILSFAIVCATKDVVLDASSTQITYTPAPEVGWLNRTLAGCEDQGRYMCSYTDYSELAVTFEGRALSVTFMKFPNGARALIEVDGVTQGTVDTYSAVQECAVEIFKMPNLTNGQHRVRIADATHSIGTRGLVFRSMTYTQDTPEEAVASISSASVASVSKTASAPTASASGPGSSLSDQDTKPNIALIAGAAGGGVVVLLLVIGVVWFVMRRRRQQPRASTASLPDVRQSANEMLIAPWIPDRTVTHPSYSHQRIASHATNQTDTSNGSTSNHTTYPETHSPHIRPISFSPYQPPGNQPQHVLPNQNVNAPGPILRSSSSIASISTQTRLGERSTVVASPPPKDPDLTKDDDSNVPPPYAP